MAYDQSNPADRDRLARAIAEYEHFLDTVPRTQLLHGPAVPFGMPEQSPTSDEERGK